MLTDRAVGVRVHDLRRRARDNIRLKYSGVQKSAVDLFVRFDTRIPSALA